MLKSCKDNLFEALKTIQEGWAWAIQHGKGACAHLAISGDKFHHYFKNKDTSFIQASEIENSDGFLLSSPSYSKYRSTPTKNTTRIGEYFSGPQVFLLRERRNVTSLSLSLSRNDSMGPKKFESYCTMHMQLLASRPSTQKPAWFAH